MWDQYVIMTTIGPSPESDAPLVKFKENRKFGGGAGLVADIIDGLGVKAIRVGDGVTNKCQKCRAILDDRLLYRMDFDYTTPIEDEIAEAIFQEIPPNTDYVLVADYGKGIVTEYLIKKLVQHYKCIVDPAKNRPFDFYSGAFGIIPNRKESGAKCVDEAIQKCCELRKTYENVCIKMDVDGMVVSTDTGCSHIKSSINVWEAVDTCGAGDAVLASIGVSLERGDNWEDACFFGNTVAGQKCKHLRWKA